MTLPIWVLEVVAFAAIALIWLAVLLCIVDWIAKPIERRRKRRALDRLWDEPQPLYRWDGGDERNVFELIDRRANDKWVP